jgi:predicted deacylase
MVEEKVDYFSKIKNFERELFTIGDPKDGSTVLFIGGIHGNEPVGLIALQDVYFAIQKYNIPIKGRIKAIQGNLPALKSQTRSIDVDLNRVWTRENIDKLKYKQLDTSVSEYREMSEIYRIIQAERAEASDQLIILDLHTTSAPSVSFCVTNEKPECLDFVRDYPFPGITGLTGYLEGTLLSYINEIGHIGLAYEAGMHQTDGSLEKHRSFIWASLVKVGLVNEKDLPFDLEYHNHNLGRDWSPSLPQTFKIVSRYHISEGEEFQMENGFRNFQRISEGELLAKNSKGQIKSPCNGHIFMPLYQEEGEDGFFIVEPFV